MALFHKKKVNTEINLADGIVMKEPLHMETSSWLKNCMVKSLLVFSVVFGAIGCFLSSIDLEYYVFPTAVLLFAMALLFTTIYYRGWLMDLVYIVFLFIFFFLVRGFQPYINSGYYLIVNQVFEIIENYFDLPGMQYYEIAVSNELLAVSVIVVFVGTVMMIVANVIVSRTMNVWFLLFMTGFLWIMPMYFRLEPDSFFVILLVTGYITVWSIHSSGAYGMDRRHRDYKWKDKKGKPLRIWYVQDAATILQSMGIFIISVLLLYGITSVAGGKDTFNIRYRQNPQKEESEAMIQDISTRGFSMFDRYAATGGISGGQLGGVGSVRPDYQTDLIVRFTPYSMEPIYLKGYTGVSYASDSSKWLNYKETLQDSPDIIDMLEELYNSNSSQYSFDYDYYADRNIFPSGLSMYENLIRQSEKVSGDYYAHGTMQIKNVGASEVYAYEPYYCMDGLMAGDIIVGGIGRNQWKSYEYEPVINFESDEEDLLFQWGQKEQAEILYLDVPEECYDAVARASEEAGITEQDSQEEIIQKVKDYFEEEFLYTTRPGRCPRNEDFVTWFLERKKGYCAHFATAATLIYRYNGIPARYIEGYVITYEDVMNGELRDEFSYDSFYEGYSSLGETGVVDVEVTDARAHAWVETLNPSLGWRVEEVTTAAIDPEEELESFWDVFGSGGSNEEASDDSDFMLDTMDLDFDDIQGIWIGLLIVLAVLLLVYGGKIGYFRWKKYRSWHTEDGTENVLAYYQLLSDNLRKREPAYGECPTYRKQLQYMESRTEDWSWNVDQLAELLEAACYSQAGISELDCKRLMLELSDIRKKTKKWKRSKNQRKPNIK